jgi:hypothetical protein
MAKKVSQATRTRLGEELRQLVELIDASVPQSVTEVRQACRKIRDLLTGSVCEDWDEVGKALEARFDETLKILTDLGDGSAKLLKNNDHEVENAVQLDQAIEELLELKQGVLEDWPWSYQELPPVDREMVAASRAAFKRGEGERIEDLIVRMGGAPAK